MVGAGRREEEALARRRDEARTGQRGRNPSALGQSAGEDRAVAGSGGPLYYLFLAQPLPQNSLGPEKSFTPLGKTMEDCAATPVRRPADPSSPSPTPSPLSLRQWRPAAQRNLRNQWSRLLAAKTRWLAATANGRSHAAALVNANLSRGYMPGMDLGVLKDMPRIRDRASAKLAHKEVQCREMLLSAYKEMVCAVSDLVKASHAMRCFSKVSSGSPLVRFTDCQDDLNDLGDGGGAPVYRWVSMLEFENLAKELVEMFVSELQLKRLIVLNLLSINSKGGADPSLEWSDELYDGELYKFQSIGLGSGDSFPLPENWRVDVLQAWQPGHAPSHEVLQVYLTSWLANVNIKTSRIDEIFELVGEEMQIKLR
ncbi:Stellacyanin [Hordeum vulgare]|nr:Stellacyanin [Hordeum vulgare]